MAIKVNGCTVIDDGKNINAGITTTTTLNVPGTATAGTGCVTGTMTAATGCIPGTTTTGTGCVTGTLTAANANIPGTVTGGVVCATTCVSAAAANVPGTVTAGTFSGSGSGLSNIPSGAITGGLSAAEVCTFNSSGTWTKPTSAKFVMVELLSGGGGGGSESAPFPAGNYGGGGGGGGGLATYVIQAPQLSPTVPVVVGSGGAGGLRSTIYPTEPCPSAYRCGADGGSSCFGSCISLGGRGASGYFAGAGGGYYSFFNPAAPLIDGFFSACVPSGGPSRTNRAMSVYSGGGGGMLRSCCVGCPFFPCQTSTSAADVMCIVGGFTGANSIFGGGGGGSGSTQVYNPACGTSIQNLSGGAGGISGCNLTSTEYIDTTSVCGAWGGRTRNPSANGCPAISQYPSECKYGGGGGSDGGTGGNGNLGGGGGGAGYNGPQGGSGGNGRVVVYTWS